MKFATVDGGLVSRPKVDVDCIGCPLDQIRDRRAVGYEMDGIDPLGTVARVH